MLKIVTQRLEQCNRYLLFTAGLSLIAVLGLIDYLTGSELAFSLFYLLPIALLAYFQGSQSAVVASSISAITWHAADILGGAHYSHAAIPYWNTLVRFSFFLIVTYLLVALRKALQHEQHLARTDQLTGASNARHFYELVHMENKRNQRYKHPFTVAYLDVDNFKLVNDRWGHATGDLLLQTIVGTLQEHVRDVDTVARLGGDEFAILLPETTPEAVIGLVSRLQERLIEAVDKPGWPVKFSIGAITCLNWSQSVEELLQLTDMLMYEVKHSGKNAVKHKILTASTDKREAIAS